ncbi:hypothetical protein KJ671_01875 [Patescibacteria group bacterium]|nr:hypothetical protein [Patescibacteria group bacterium]
MYKLKTILFSTIIVLTLMISTTFAWTNPSANPPDGSGTLTASTTNIGIGTTNPGYKLDVNGTLRVSSSATFSGAFSVGAGLYVGTGGGGMYINTIGARSAGDGFTIQGRRTAASGLPSVRIISETGLNNDDIAVQIGGNAPVMNIMQGGNVGIASTTPWGLLSVNPNGITGPAFVVGSSTVTNLIVTNGGNVGIGTTAPAEKLTLPYGNKIGFTFSDANLNVYNSIGKPATGNSPLTFSATYAPPTADDIFDFRNNLGSVMVIEQSGEVGIGTTDPDGKLTVNTGEIRIKNADTYGLSFDYSSWTQNARIWLSDTFQLNLAGHTGIQMFSNHLNGVWTPRFAIDMSGNVSLGNGKLYVKESTANVGIASTTPWGLLSVNPNGITGPAFVVGSSTVTNLIVTNGGNVGIGTSAPNKLLHLKTASGNAELDIQSVDSPYWGIYQDDTTDDLRFWNVDNRMTITDAGNVGIGTVSPTSLLEIVGDASLDSFSTNTNALPAIRDSHSSIVANGYIYVIGGYDDSSAVSTVYYAELNSDGSTGTWSTNANALPVALYGHSSVVANGYVYVIGGANVSTVYYAKLNSDGSTGTWSTNTNALPTTRYVHSSVVANGYVYVIGGYDGTNYQSTVYYAELNSDGSTGTWSTNANALPAIGGNRPATVSNGYVYVTGGWDKTNVLSTVYYAKLNSDGSTGTWSTNANALPAARSNHSSVVANGYVYIIGGGDTGGYRSTVYYAELNSDGSTGTWSTNANALPGIRVRHSSVVANGYVYVIGGNDSFNNQSTVYYASTARIKFKGNLDLLGLTSSSLTDSPGDTGSSIFAGNIFSNNTLEVGGNAQFWNGVGINGNLTVNDGLSVSGTVDMFGAWESKSADTSYLAESDGFVVIHTLDSTSSILTDSANPPTIVRAWVAGVVTGNRRGSGTVPVRKGDYWKVVTNTGTAATIFWIPLGQ